MDHECIMKPDVKDIADGVKSLTVDVAVMKSDIMELKAATVLMSACVRTLTESMLVSQQTSVTREKFYDALKSQENELHKRIDESDKTIQLHQTYFKIIWVVFGFAWALLFFILNKMWVQ